LLQIYNVPATDFTQALAQSSEFEFLQKNKWCNYRYKFIEAVYLEENKTKYGREFHALMFCCEIPASKEVIKILA